MIITNSATITAIDRGLRREQRPRAIDEATSDRDRDRRAARRRVDLDVLERIADPHAALLASATTAARSRARRSASSTSATSSAVPGAFVQHFLDDLRDLGPRDAAGEERLDRDLVGAPTGSRAPSRPPARPRRRAPRHGNVAEVGHLEVEAPERRPVDRAERLGQPVRARRARARSAGACRASRAARSSRRRRTRPCCARPTAGGRPRRCWSKSTPNSSCASITSRPLFIKRRAVDRDLGAHAPGRVRERVGDRDVARARARGPAAERPAARGQHDAARPRTPRPARRHCQTAECSESTGTISPPPAARALATTGPAAMRLSLFASASRLPACSARERRRQSGEADDRVEHDVGVGMRRELREHVGRRRRRRGPGRPGRRTRRPAARAARRCGRPRARRRGSRRGGATGRRAPACRSIRSIPG